MSLDRTSLVLTSAFAFLYFATSAVAQTTTAPAAAATAPAPDAKPAPKIYELRIYQTNPGKLPDLHARFREHTMKLFEKHGMENVIYWTLAEDFREEKKDNTLIYVLAHKDKAAADASWAAFRADPEWQAVAAKSEENGKILSGTPVSIFLNPTEFHPGEWQANAKSDKPARLFELRKYNDGVERVPGTVDRFKSWEADLFRNSGIETLGFWTTADNSAFVYLLGHPDRDTATRNWQTFFTGFRGRRGSPSPQVREEATQATATQGAATAQPGEAAPAAGARRRGRGGAGGGSEVRWLVPTDYSPRK